jgi:hypothetical protein
MLLVYHTSVLGYAYTLMNDFLNIHPLEKIMITYNKFCNNNHCDIIRHPNVTGDIEAPYG